MPKYSTMGDDNRVGGIFIIQFSPLLAAYVLAFIIALVSAVLVWVFGFAQTR